MMHRSRFEVIVGIAGADTTDDPWSWSMELFFDVASVLDMSDIEGDVSPGPFDRWQYRRGAVTVPAIEDVAARADDFSEGEWADDYSYAQVSLAVAYQNGELTQQDLIYAGDVLDKYTTLLRIAGKDY